MSDKQPQHVSLFIQELLRDHGIDLYNVNIPPSAAAVAQQEAAARALAARDLEIRIKALLARRVPAKDIERIVSGELVETHALAAVRRWLADDKAPRLLVLAGHKDAGKTTACACAVEADPSDADQVWLVRGAPHGRYIEAELLLKAWWHRDSVDAGGRRVDVDPVTGLSPAVLLNCSLLAIDDVGQEPAAFVADVAEALDSLVRLRCDRRQRTVISTNELTAEGLIARYNVNGRGQRISERLTEHGLWVNCPPEGLRATGRRKKVLAQRQAGTR